MLSVWGLVQPLVSAYVLFGSTFFAAAEKMWNDFAAQIGIDAEYGVWIIVGAVDAEGASGGCSCSDFMAHATGSI